MKTNLKTSKKIGTQGEVDVVVETHFDPNADEFICQCCGQCRTCHIQIGCIVICILYILYALGNIINAAVLLHQFSSGTSDDDNPYLIPEKTTLSPATTIRPLDSGQNGPDLLFNIPSTTPFLLPSYPSTPTHQAGTVSYLVCLFIVYPVMVIVTAFGVFVGIYKVRPRLILPYIAILGLGLVVCAIASIMNVLAVTAVTNAAWPSVKQNVKFQKKIFGPLAASTQPVATSSWSYVVGFLLIAAFVVYCIYLHAKLYRYLRHKRNYMCLSNGCHLDTRRATTDSGY